MKILKINVLRGPNYWSIKRPRVIVMQLDLETMEARPTDTIAGFYDRLKNALPGLYNHHCSEDKAGGFFTRVREGTWMGHVIEHIALELQVMAGFEVGFGRTRSTGTKGCYHVVFDYVEEESGRLAALKAVAIAQDLVDGTIPGIGAAVEAIRAMYHRYKPGPSTASILREAQKRGIPHIKLAEGSTYSLATGAGNRKSPLPLHQKQAAWPWTWPTTSRHAGNS